uniref:Aldo/keto reductase n=1 Tax=Caulobacter sp. (strain K31) TaxID=366602 RepID=B0T6P3_CAUSK
MELRKLGASGFLVPQLSLGTGMFVPSEVFSQGNVDLPLATRLIDISIEHGANMFDSGHTYWNGHSEILLGEALKGRRHKAIISTKAGHPPQDGGSNDIGASRYHLTQAIDQSLKRLGTDYIDVFQLHTFDALTPPEETLATLDTFVRAGKIRYIGVSNTPGWALMKSLAVAERASLPRYVVHQVYYSLIGRDYEWELMPLGADQGVSAAVWSPLGWGRLTGRLKRGQPAPADSRLILSEHIAPQADEQTLHDVLDVLRELAEETGKLIPQIAINWLLQRPTVATVIMGARTEEQLLQNLGAAGWSLAPEQIKRLDAVSRRRPSYPTDFYLTADRHRNPPSV